MAGEVPECPVCLQVYNHQDTVPRVLSCGHSVCQSCLPQLTHPFPNTIRCPACTQLVHYPHPQGPSALPKNIDLLSFLPSNPNPNPNPNPRKISIPDFLPSFHHQTLYSIWKHWILPSNSLLVTETGSLFDGQIASHVFMFSAKVDSSSVFDISYSVRIVEALSNVKEKVRDELFLFLKAFSREFGRFKAYGLWMDSKDGSVFLVCRGFENKLVGCGVEGGMTGFAMLGMELCQVLVGLHSQGLVTGCLSLDCFGLDEFGHVFVDPTQILAVGRRVRKYVLSCRKINVETSSTHTFRIQAFVSPEVFLKLFNNEGLATSFTASVCSVGYYSDVWPLCCVLVSLLVGDLLVEELFKELCCCIREADEEKVVQVYRDWVGRVSCKLETVLGTDSASLHQILCSCLEFDPESRPRVMDVWRCIRELIIKPNADVITVDPIISMENVVHCITLGNLCSLPKETVQTEKQKGLDLQGIDGAEFHKLREGDEEKDVVEGLGIGKFESISLTGHLDCITGLAVGGGFLFSSSFDKTVHVWSLQDFSHVQSFRGHEHRIMAVIFVDANEPLCISADSGGGIFVWDISISSEKEPLKKWYEPKDWRYSGIHALAVSGTEHIYTGSGDKTIKAWSLQEYTLTCTMNGHKSVVSSLVVSDGVLYSGSWDGSIHLWSLHDHSPLTVLVDDIPGNLTSVLSLSVDHNILVASHENGSLKIWKNDVLSRSIETGNGAILTLDMAGKWLFTGGLDKTINVQELSGNELEVDIKPIGSIGCNAVITALLYWEGKLFAGYADRIIKMAGSIL